ncbi:MAG: (2Fe-2S)-binding protein [Planctomycetes bacterium]|nr:(2Fe-2S)-binding protein [Planctomycetota bacterium]
MERAIALKVNGRSRTVTTDPERPLLEVLREDLELTGTKYGCGEGQCGACTVLVDGKSAPSCVTAVGDVEGKEIVTIEGLASGGKLHPVQEAFLEEDAFQCGYCTPGMILEVKALLDEKPEPTDEEILSALNGHICRCCHYTKILKAVRRAASKVGR